MATKKMLRRIFGNGYCVSDSGDVCNYDGVICNYENNDAITKKKQYRYFGVGELIQKECEIKNEEGVFVPVPESLVRSRRTSDQTIRKKR